MFQPTSQLLAPVAGLLWKIGWFISSLAEIGDDFQELCEQFRRTIHTVERLEGIFKSEALPEDSVTKYMVDLKRAEDDIDAIDTIVQNITVRLDKNHSSILTRVKTRADLINGEQQKIEKRLGWFTQNVQNMLATHQSQVLNHHSQVLNHHSQVLKEVQKTVTGQYRGAQEKSGLRQVMHKPSVALLLNKDEWGCGERKGRGQEGKPPGKIYDAKTMLPPRPPPPRVPPPSYGPDHTEPPPSYRSSVAYNNHCSTSNANFHNSHSSASNYNLHRNYGSHNSNNSSPHYLNTFSSKSTLRKSVSHRVLHTYHASHPLQDYNEWG
jgi:23S rRNA U2552 (ribose-2'-O)-methylase RlmE/FtsJ